MERLFAVTVRDWLERSKSGGMSLGLERTMATLEKLGRPDKSLQCKKFASLTSPGAGAETLH